MRLFIAEKPSVAKAIAEALGVTGKDEGVIHCGPDKITWCFGHMLQLAEPDEYTNDEVARSPKTGKKLWRVEDLPIIPNQWIIKPKEEAKKQLKIIGALLKEASLIVNAGDSDREGQLLIDEVLEHFNNKKPVLRFWVAAHDLISLERGLKAMKDNREYLGLGRAANARAKADWLIGMNLSRAYTLSASRRGANALVTVGRVQTPTLKLVVDRDRDIEAFKSIPFHTIKAQFHYEANRFIANWQACDDQQGLDEQGRLIDTAIADALVNKVAGKAGNICQYQQEPKTKAQPRAYSLSDLTLVASNRYGFSAAEVLESCQALYETHKLTSYPRTDCSYLPESQHNDAPAVLEALKVVNPDFTSLITKANPAIKSKTWDDSKVTVHFGIIPTMHKGSKAHLTEKELKIYELILRSYLAQFYPAHEFLTTTIEMEVTSERFVVKGKTIVKTGWCEVYQEESETEGEDEVSQSLPTMKLGDVIHCLDVKRIDAKTKPAPRFTEGTLQRAMENIHKIIPDTEHKKILKDGDGIGTPATRASIISELKRRNFIESKGKTIVSTPLGKSIIDILPDLVKSPVLTAVYERMLKAIEKEPIHFDAFIEKQIKFVSEQVKLANSGQVTLKGVKPTFTVSTQYTCQNCSEGLCRRKGTKGYWWSCSGYPACKKTYRDVKGMPVFENQL